MKSYSAENRFQWFFFSSFTTIFSFFRFQLHYFSNTVTKAKKDTVLTIDTRGSKNCTNMNDDEDFDEVEDDPVEKAIQSK